MFGEVDLELLIAVCDDRAIVDKALLVHPLAHARLSHQVDKPGFKDTGADAPQDIVLGFSLQNDRIDPFAMQQL